MSSRTSSNRFANCISDGLRSSSVYTSGKLAPSETVGESLSCVWNTTAGWTMIAMSSGATGNNIAGGATSTMDIT